MLRLLGNDSSIVGNRIKPTHFARVIGNTNYRNRYTSIVAGKVGPFE